MDRLLSIHNKELLTGIASYRLPQETLRPMLVFKP
jgi:hypothetical protein